MTAVVGERTVLRMMPLARELGIEFDRIEPAVVVGRLAWAERLCTAGGIMHGGALVSLADSVAGLCAYLNLPAGAATSTIELKSNFFAAVRQGEVTAVARPLHVGRTVIVVQTDLYVDGRDGTRVAQTTQTQAVIG